jgi:hypothetical protein
MEGEGGGGGCGERVCVGRHSVHVCSDGVRPGPLWQPQSPTYNVIRNPKPVKIMMLTWLNM